MRAPDLNNESNKTCLVSKTKIIDFEVKNYISFPIFSDNKIVAVIGVGNRSTPYVPDDLDKLGVYVKIGWPIVTDLLKAKDEDEFKQSNEFMQQPHESVLVAMAQAFGKALELRDE
jgi:hypothetical protein